MTFQRSIYIPNGSKSVRRSALEIRRLTNQLVSQTVQKLQNYFLTIKNIIFDFHEPIIKRG